MRVIREFLRRLRYKINFLLKKKKSNISYISSLNSNNELTDLMNLYGSDKGGKNNDHNYTNYYSEIFFYRRNQIKNFLEVGLGTNNQNLVSNMGLKGVPLASLRAWRDYFINANIYGADVDKNILKNEDRIRTYYVDQTDPTTINELFLNIGDVKFDIILDDGLHDYEANICFFENSINYLNGDGIYIIEDIYYKDQNKFLNYFKKKNYVYKIINIYHEHNIKNNCLLVIKKNLLN
tara:strand:- start:325 stop:1032 length:708 start_codon:yes stop_codon:yes gene_type:complete